MSGWFTVRCPRVQIHGKRTPGHAACGGCGGFRSGHAIEHDIFRIIVVEQQFVRAFRHGDPSSFIGQIALYTLSVAGIDLDTYSVGRSRTQNLHSQYFHVLFPSKFLPYDHRRKYVPIPVPSRKRDSPSRKDHARRGRNTGLSGSSWKGMSILQT